MRRCSSVRFAIVGAILIASILTSATLLATPAAQADGDPASDVLVNATLFNPVDSGIPFATVDRLQELLALSAKAGFPIRVAMINSANDLGTVTPLWDKPKQYAIYLDTELSDLYGGQILVVMPDGFGLYGPAHGAHAVGAAELAVTAVAPGPGVKLATAALSAVPLLARAAGHTLAAADAIPVVSPPAPTTRTPFAAWLALVLGLVAIAACWWASLRARPVAFKRAARP